MNDLGIDSLWRYSFSLDCFSRATTDTLSQSTQWHAQEVFGSGSILVAQSAGSHGIGCWLTSPTYFHIALVAMFVLFSLSFVIYPMQISGLFKSLFSPLYCDKILRERSHIFSSLLHRLTSIGVVMLAMFLVRLGDQAGVAMEELRPFGYWLMPLIVCAIVLIVLYQHIVLRLVGYLTMNHPFIETLWYLKGVLFSVATMIISPFCFLYFLNYSISSEVLLWAILSLVLLLFIVWLFKSYRLFMEQNFSILQWILYLCGVELLPVSFAVLIIMRS